MSVSLNGNWWIRDPWGEDWAALFGEVHRHGRMGDWSVWGVGGWEVLDWAGWEG